MFNLFFFSFYYFFRGEAENDGISGVCARTRIYYLSRLLINKIGTSAQQERRRRARSRRVFGANCGLLNLFAVVSCY